MNASPRTILVLALAGLAPACRTAADPEGGSAEGATFEAREAATVPPPLALEGPAYDSAGAIALPAQEPEAGPGLSNVYHLSADIISGSEPHGREALEELSQMGVRTIVSVDGSAPDAETAAELGMRYVHIPIQYRGITDEELARLAKTYRELEPPFYVHCFHGKHRGPAAAAVGRVVLDGAPRETAIAEMRQYCGTSPKYEGLYRVIAAGDIPDADSTAALEYGFEPVHTVEGVASLMVVISRAFDHVEALGALDWEVDPEHPDLDAMNEARRLEEAFSAALEMPEVREGPADLQAWFVDSRDLSRRTVDSLRRDRAGDSLAGADAQAAVAELGRTCNACHGVYRN